VSTRTRKDGITMHHTVDSGVHHWQARRGDVASEWFADAEHKTGYQQAIDDLLIAEAYHATFGAVES
jgi:hypothetical protein